MITFQEFHAKGDIPLYIQIILYVKRGIAAGQITDGDELPSRRMLSALLGINPNTVQKAYRMLEEEGLVVSHSGAKSCVVLEDRKMQEVRAELLENDVKKMVASMRQMGISKEEAVELVRSLWEEQS